MSIISNVVSTPTYEEQMAELRAKNQKDKEVFVEIPRDPEVPEEYQAIITKMIHSLVEHNFCHGWFGDSSREFKEEQLKDYMSCYKKTQKSEKKYGVRIKIMHLNYIDSYLFNLGRYCGWTLEDLLVLAKNIEATEEQIEKMKRRMTNC